VISAAKRLEKKRGKELAGFAGFAGIWLNLLFRSNIPFWNIYF
jgi:hypothetical protein